MTSRRTHWDKVYETKLETTVSWFQADPHPSIDLIRKYAPDRASCIVDVGGGASRLADALLEDGYRSITVLDLSPSALDRSKARLGSAASRVDWIVADATQWTTDHQFDLWHDRAAFHFLVDPMDRTAYATRLAATVRSGGHAIVGTFALDGPERCSGLEVIRYDSATMAAALGDAFRPVASLAHTHVTPSGATQSFQFTVLRRS
jgi:SAM-dependent methyltransferase